MDGGAGIAGVFMVQDANTRMAPEAAAVQAELVTLLNVPRFTQSAGAATPPPSSSRPQAGRGRPRNHAK